MRQLQLAVVGCGDIARFTALFARLVPQVALAACCDIDRERATRFARKHRIPRAYDDFARLLDESTCDAVYLAVPHFLHAEMIRAAVQAGKSVLVGLNGVAPLQVSDPLRETCVAGLVFLLGGAISVAKIGV